MNSKQRKTLGIGLFVISVLFWFVLISLPLLPYKGKMMVTIGTICFVLGEVLFYLSVFVLGRELYTNYKNRLHPRNWFRKKVLRNEKNKSIISTGFNTTETEETSHL